MNKLILMLFLLISQANKPNKFLGFASLSSYHIANIVTLTHLEKKLTNQDKKKIYLILIIGNFSLAALRIKNFNKTDFPAYFSDNILKYSSIAHIILTTSYGIIALNRFIKMNN